MLRIALCCVLFPLAACAIERADEPSTDPIADLAIEPADDGEEEKVPDGEEPPEEPEEPVPDTGEEWVPTDDDEPVPTDEEPILTVGGGEPGDTVTVVLTEEAGDGAEQLYGDNVRGFVGKVLNKPIPDGWTPAGWTPSRPANGYLSGGTANHKLLARVWFYGWAIYTNSPELEAARNKLHNDIFLNQNANGHYAIHEANEVLNTSHYQLWAQGVAAARIFARRDSNPLILNDTKTWMRREKALWDVLQRGNDIDAPGARFKSVPPQAAPTAAGRVLRNVNYRQYKNIATGVTSGFFLQKYNASSWMLRELRTLGDNLGDAANAGPADRPKLRNPLCVCTKGSDFVFAFPVMEGVIQPIFWVKRIGTTLTYGPYSTQPQLPIPRISGATLTVIPGLRSPGACVEPSGMPVCAAP